MTQEEKAKAYDEAVNKLRRFMEQGVEPLITRADVQDFFPELAESKDEWIRKEIAEFICNAAFKPRDIKKKEKWLAWLEKQGEKPQGKSALEVAMEEKVDNANKVEPKFHEGDWITNGYDTWKIVEVKLLDYILQSQDGNIVDDTISYVDEQFDSFTIKDAKDGDVLVNGSNIFIFSHLSDTRAMGYCHVNIDDGRFYDDKGKNECFGLIDAVFTPATKEQRELLFAKMREEGFEWDVEKKELRKILKLSNSAKVGMDEE